MCSLIKSASRQTGLADEKPFARNRGDVFRAFWVGASDNGVSARLIHLSAAIFSG